MTDLSDDEVSLQSLFDPAKKLISDIEEGSFSTSDLQPRLKTGIENLQEVTKLVDQLRLFSSNEQMEDVPTTSLPYLMAPCFLGIFHQNLMVDPDLKLDELRKSKVYLRSFLNRLRDLCLITTRLPWEDEDTEDANITKEKPKMADEEIGRLKSERHNKKQELKMSELRIKKQLEAVSIDEQNLRDLYNTQLLYWSERSYEELEAIEEELSLWMMSEKDVQPKQIINVELALDERHELADFVTCQSCSIPLGISAIGDHLLKNHVVACSENHLRTSSVIKSIEDSKILDLNREYCLPVTTAYHLIKDESNILKGDSQQQSEINRSALLTLLDQKPEVSRNDYKYLDQRLTQLEIEIEKMNESKKAENEELKHVIAQKEQVIQQLTNDIKKADDELCKWKTLYLGLEKKNQEMEADFNELKVTLDSRNYYEAIRKDLRLLRETQFGEAAEANAESIERLHEVLDGLDTLLEDQLLEAPSPSSVHVPEEAKENPSCLCLLYLICFLFLVYIAIVTFFNIFFVMYLNNQTHLSSSRPF